MNERAENEFPCGTTIFVRQAQIPEEAKYEESEKERERNVFEKKEGNSCDIHCIVFRSRSIGINLGTI